MMRLISVALLGLLFVKLDGSILACDASDDTDFPSSMALAKQSNRPLLLAFLGTDWSISSLKLDREVFDQAAFADNSKYNFLLCKIHFYQTQERDAKVLRQNRDLAIKYHIEQFPTVVVLRPDGAELGRFGYISGGVEKFAAEVNKLISASHSSSSAQ
ncbi:MAG TPA: thioredoxin family protein [Chthoniobacterales bacterium]|nr:thioredoxin family protein [Chthoniobacterales bacterium]